MKDKDDLVRATVFIILEFVVRLRRPGAIRGHVLIEQHRDAAGVKIAAARNVRRLQMMMPQRTVGNFLRFPMFDQLHIAHASGRPQVIHDRVGLIESLRREDMFVGDAFVLIGRRRAVAMKPDVMLFRNLTESLIIRHSRSSRLQIAPRVLFAFEGFEECFEISFAETLRAFALDDFEKQRRSVFDWFGENLEQITFIVAIDENAQPLQRFQFFVDVTHPIGQRVVITRWNLQEFDTASFVGPSLFQ